MGTRERIIINQVLLNLTDNKRLIRVNAGTGWSGKIVKHDQEILILKNPRPFHGLPAGWPDLLGLETIEITPDMVGKKIGIFCAEEIKATGDLSDQQKKVKKLILNMGGIYRVIRE